MPRHMQHVNLQGVPTARIRRQTGLTRPHATCQYAGEARQREGLAAAAQCHCLVWTAQRQQHSEMHAESVLEMRAGRMQEPAP